jgi:autotransporter-associated beta strand protein
MKLHILSTASIFIAFGVPHASATDFYWDGGTANWSTATAWSTVAGANTPNPGSFPSSSTTSDLIFNITTASATANTVSLAGGSRLARSLTFNTSGASGFRAGGNSSISVNLTLGAGGITLNSGAGSVTISQNPSTSGVITTVLSSNQTWSNNGAGVLSVLGNVNNGANLLTVDGSANTSISGVIGSGTGGLTKNGSGKLTLSASNTYTGATSVSAGSLFVTGSLTSDVTLSGTATIGGGGTVAALSLGGSSFFDIADVLASSNPLDASTISFAAAGFGIDNLKASGAAVDWNGVAVGTYTLINGALDSTNLENFGLENAYDLGGGKSAYFQSGSLQLVVIPETSSLILGGLGLLSILRRRR